MSSKQRVMVQPINVIFKYMQQQTKVSLWLYDIVDYRLEGHILGFDEFMNVVMGETEEVWIKKDAGKRRHLGRILLKGDNITLIQPVLTS